MASSVARKSLSKSDSFNIKNLRIPTAEVEISVSASNLEAAPTDSVACALRIREFGQEKWRPPVWKTESIQGQNPRFTEKYHTEYFFEEKQHLQFEMHITDKRHDLVKLVGCMNVTLGSVVSCMTVTEDLVNSKGVKAGDITVKAEELEACKEEVTLQWRAENLFVSDVSCPNNPRKSTWKPTVYMEIAREDMDTCGFTVVFISDRMEVSDGVASWSPFSISLQTLCNGDPDRPLKITCWNQDQSLLGEFLTTFEDLQDLPNGSKDFKLKDTNGDTLSKMVLVSYTQGFQYTFLDYIQGGMQIALTVAIDFTQSNGNPCESNSLHYLGNLKTNPYATAINTAVSILADYDSDNKIPTFGFGAIPQGEDSVSHLFPLNGNPADPFCHKVQGILDAYKLAVQSSTLHGPSYFAPIINYISKQAQRTLDGSVYYILMIITDGSANDMPATRKAIIKAAKLPISIVILGVGDSDEEFKAMHQLDGDVARVRWKDEVAVRDIVQFTQFRDVAGKQEALAKSLMEEIPGQVNSFMKYRQVTPNAPRPRSVAV